MRASNCGTLTRGGILAFYRKAETLRAEIARLDSFCIHADERQAHHARLVVLRTSLIETLAEIKRREDRHATRHGF